GVATASTTSASSASRSSSWSPSQSTRKLPDPPPSTWIVMPGRTSSPSSNPSRSMSKWARPMPHALCVGFSRSWALIAIWKACRFFAIFVVSVTPRRLSTGSGGGDARDDDVEAVFELLVAAHRLGHLGAHLAQQREVLPERPRGLARREARVDERADAHLGAAKGARPHDRARSRSR